jgi:hypothetical protein
MMLVSCAWGTSFTQTGKRYPPYRGDVQVYYEQPAGLHYEEIGLVSTEANQVHLKASAIKSLQEKAAEKGANAIIMAGLEERDKDTDLPGSRNNMDEAAQSGIPRSGLFRPNPDYAPRYVTIKARAIRIEPVQ